jgi:hypothetical protein
VVILPPAIGGSIARVRATVAEQRLPVDDLVDAVRIFPDRLTVEVTGAPPDPGDP